MSQLFHNHHHSEAGIKSELESGCPVCSKTSSIAAKLVEIYLNIRNTLKNPPESNLNTHASTVSQNCFPQQRSIHVMSRKLSLLIAWRYIWLCRISLPVFAINIRKGKQCFHLAAGGVGNEGTEVKGSTQVKRRWSRAKWQATAFTSVIKMNVIFGLDLMHIMCHRALSEAQM